MARTKVMFPGLKNSQRIRVIIDGVGFYTEIQRIDTDFVYDKHKDAIKYGLDHIAKEKLLGFGFQWSIWNEKQIDVQIVLVSIG
jgi:hypothetical protein